MRRSGAVVWLFAVALLATACEGLATRPVPYGTVRVRAMTRDSVPLPGIGVELFTGFRAMGYSVTDADGRVTFPLVPRSQYGVLMKLPSHYARLSEILPVPPGDVTDEIDIEARMDTLITFVFARRGPGTIEALVVDQDQVPIPGIRVTRYDPFGIHGHSISDDAGIARFYLVPFGHHGVFIVTTDTLGVPGGQVVAVDGLAMEQDLTLRPRLVLERCEGTVRVTARDQTDAPIAGIGVQIFRFTGVERTVNTNASGVALFTRVACDNWGVLLSQTPGYTITYTSGLGVVDGLIIGNQAALDVTLRASTP